MSAADVSVDTLTFRDLLRLALEDVPGASQGEWTLHGPVDPGVTVLELFAYQFEQRLFMGEQLTEPIVRAGVRLLGLPDPAPALPAATVLRVTSPGGARRVPAGTVFALTDDPQGRRFTLDEDVWALPAMAVGVSGSLLEDGDVLELALSGGTAPAGAELSLLVEVVAAPGVEGAWRSGAVDVEPPAQLRWSAIGPDGSSAPVAVEDRTGAFRRSGLLRLPWPDVFDRPGGEPRRLRATAVSASFTEAVRIISVHPSAVVARHRVATTTDVGAQLRGLLPLPAQILRLADAAGQLIDDDVVLSVLERDGAHDWHGVRSWVGRGPGERVVRVDRERGELHFGDGLSGRILRPADPPQAEVAYGLGAGRAGNVGRARGWAEEGGTATAVNPVAAEDGAEPETLDAVRQRVADALDAPDRTVTAADARDLAQTTPGLGLRRAHVSPGLHPGFPCAAVAGALAVTIVPHADRAGDPTGWTAGPQPDAGAVATVRARLERARLLGQEVFVLAPVYRAVTVDVTVSATAQANGAREVVVNALRRHLDALVGGTEAEGWPFGARPAVGTHRRGAARPRPRGDGDAPRGGARRRAGDGLRGHHRRRARAGATRARDRHLGDGAAVRRWPAMTWGRDVRRPELVMVPGAFGASEPQLLPPARRAIRAQVTARAGAYVPDWTSRRPDDAGMALVHVYGTVAEAVDLRLNRIPAKLVLEGLDLAGVRALRARPAFAVLAIRVADGAPAPIDVPEGSAFVVPGGPFPVVLETLEGCQALPGRLASVAVLATGWLVDDAPEDLSGLAPFGLRPQVPAELWLGIDAPVAPVSLLSVAVELVTPSGRATAASVATVAADAPPTLRWEAMTSRGAAELPVERDGTAGLSRSGVLSLRTQTPAPWTPRPLPGRPEGAPLLWVRARLITNDYPADRRLARVTLNGVPAMAARSIRGEVLEPLERPRTGRARYRLSQVPVVPGSVLIDVTDVGAEGEGPRRRGPRSTTSAPAVPTSRFSSWTPRLASSRSATASTGTLCRSATATSSPACTRPAAGPRAFRRPAPPWARSAASPTSPAPPRSRSPPAPTRRRPPNWRCAGRPRSSRGAAPSPRPTTPSWRCRPTASTSRAPTACRSPTRA